MAAGHGRLALVVGLLFAWCLGGAAVAAPYTIYDVGRLPGADADFLPYQHTDLGLLVGSQYVGGNIRGAVWSREYGLQDVSFPGDVTSMIGVMPPNAPVMPVWSYNGSDLLRAGAWRDGVTHPLAPVPGTPFAGATASNRHGHVAGNAYFASGVQAVRWTAPDTPEVLEKPAGMLHSFADRITDQGVVTGWSQTALYSHATVWPGAAATLLTAPGDEYSWIQASNGASRVVGHSGRTIGGEGNNRGVVWDPVLGLVFIEPDPGKWLVLNSINGAGHMMGATGQYGSDEYRALYFSDPLSGPVQVDIGADLHHIGIVDFTDTALAVGNSWLIAEGWNPERGNLDLGYIWSPAAGFQPFGLLPGYAESTARLANNAGQVVGVSYNQYYSTLDQYAAVWQDGLLTPVGLPAYPNSELLGITESGVAFGQAYQAGDYFGGSGLIWHQTTGVLDINTWLPAGSPFVRMTSVQGVAEDLRFLYGVGQREDGSFGTWVLMHNEPTGEPVPEPGTLAMLGMGALVGLRRRRKQPDGLATSLQP